MKKRYELFQQMIACLDEGTASIAEYDSLLHDYHGVILYQAESQIIKEVGNHPGITASECAKKQKKTNSACSQIIRKLKEKGWIHQVRNECNNREYNLYLTDEGNEIYEKHRAFEEECYLRTFHMLDDIPEEELRIYIKIQSRLNQAFLLDVEDSKKA